MTPIVKPEGEIPKNTLQATRGPNCIAWLLFGSYIVLTIWIFSLSSNVYLRILLISGITCGLDIIGYKEHLKLYKQENKVVYEKYNWFDKLCLGYTGQFNSSKLTDIRHVGVSEIGLHFLLRNGQTINFNMEGQAKETIQNFRKEINYFLNISRLKYLEHFDPSDRLLLASDSEEYLHNLQTTYLPTSHELTASDNVLSSSRARYQIQQNLSFPSLTHGGQLGGYRLANSKRGRYTENSTRPSRIMHTRNICPSHGNATC